MLGYRKENETTNKGSWQVMSWLIKKAFFILRFWIGAGCLVWFCGASMDLVDNLASSQASLAPQHNFDLAIWHQLLTLCAFFIVWPHQHNFFALLMQRLRGAGTAVRLNVLVYEYFLMLGVPLLLYGSIRDDGGSAEDGIDAVGFWLVLFSVIGLTHPYLKRERWWLNLFYCLAFIFLLVLGVSSVSVGVDAFRFSPPILNLIFISGVFFLGGLSILAGLAALLITRSAAPRAVSE